VGPRMGLNKGGSDWNSISLPHHPGGVVVKNFEGFTGGDTAAVNFELTSLRRLVKRINPN